MKMWFMNIMMLLFFCFESSTGNVTVQFNSRNFHNILHWDPAKSDFPGQRLLYSVKYRSDDSDQSYKIKDECQNITALYCDLTAETPSVYDVYYQAKVLVNGRTHGSTKTRFKPSEHTILGPPILSTSTTESSLFVNATLPVGPNGVSIADIIINGRKVPSETKFIYILNLNYPDGAAMHVESHSGQFIIDLKKKSYYCGTVIYKPSSNWGRPSSESASFCVTLPENPWLLLRWLLLSAAAVVALVIVSAVCTCKYVKGGKSKSMTQALKEATASGAPKILQDPDKNLVISQVEVCPHMDETVYAKIQMNKNGSSVRNGGYSPQDIPFPPWQDHTGSSVDTRTRRTPNPEDTSAQSSDIYSSVAVLPKEDNDIQQVVTERGEVVHHLIARDARPLPDADSCDSNPHGKLLLHTVRDINGQLVLPLLNFQLQSSNSDAICPSNQERKPLLSDLIPSKDESSLASLLSLNSSEWSDSGCDDSTATTPTHSYCNTHFPPSQPLIPDSDKECETTLSSDVSFESGYKENWMPKLCNEPSIIDSCRRTGYMWTCNGSKMEEDDDEEVEDQGELQKSRPIFLGSWTIRIQE